MIEKEQNGVHIEGHIKIFNQKRALCLLTNAMQFIMRI